MSDESKSLAESMKMVFSDNRTKGKDDGSAPSVIPNWALIRERSSIIVQILRAESDLSLISEERLEPLRARIRELVDRDETPLQLAEKGLLLQEVLDEVFGFGPLSQLLRDPRVRDICVNGTSGVYAMIDGKFEKTSVFFRNQKHLLSTIEKIIEPLGLRLTKNNPFVTASLPNGSRVEAAISPASIDGPILSIACFGTQLRSLGQLFEAEVMSRAMAQLLKSYAQNKVSIVISGFAGSGRSTLLNALSNHLPLSERIVSIEERAELRLQHEHWVRLEAVPADANGQQEITVRSLIPVAGRMFADRIIVGECRGAEGYEFLQSLNNGRSGDITKVSARSPSDCLRRFENMIRLADPGMPADFGHELIGRNLQVIIQTERQSDGKYRITEIAELTEYNGKGLMLTTMHRLQREEVEANGEQKYSFFDCEEQSRFI